MGKSMLLQDIAARLGLRITRGATMLAPAPGQGVMLWDLGPSALTVRLPAVFEDGTERLIVAKRPDVEITGLARAVMYGRAEILSAADLRLQRDELSPSLPAGRIRGILERTGGWPLLLPFETGAALPEEQLTEMIEREFLRHLCIDDFVLLGEILAGRAPVSAPINGLAPLVSRRQDGELCIGVEAVRPIIGEAYRNAMARRVADPADAGSLSRSLLGRGRTTEAIVSLQQAGNYDAALEVLNAAKGHFYIYRYGQAAFDTVLAGFPLAFARRHETLVLCYALQALKRGDVARARQLIGDHGGDGANRPLEVFGRPGDYSVGFRFFRVLMLIYEDVFITDKLFEQIFSLMGELAADADLERGSFYNSLLEFYIRRRRFAEAEDVAVRARQCYAVANVPILQFYISLHRAVMRLLQADANEAQRFAAEAEANLAACAFESPNDQRLLGLLRACIQYEGGRSEPLARFLSVELDDFSHSEIWPTIIDLALHYGSQALSEHFSTIVARSFLDRWRVYQVHNRQFQAMIDIREATVLQNGNRWHEAADKLASVSSRIGREWIEAAILELSRLLGRDEIALAMAWLRQLVFEGVRREQVGARLDHMLANLQLTGRQRISIEIWQAYIYRQRRDPSKSRTALLRTLERAARLGAHGPLAEERFFLVELIANRRMYDFLHTVPHIRQLMRRLSDNGLVGSPLGAKNGLSRRETKVLMMIAEGGSSKLIAKSLGVTEATIKYHLGNIYRKLGCRRRREAIDAARALGLVS
jgi:ATP/maltotriose-dependent transcriptional regulator MalT